MSKKIRNISVIAHVDHGKTTLVDKLVSFSEIRNNFESMDSSLLEKLKGITISSKVISVPYKDYMININDTPGHVDFGDQVSSSLTMTDGVILVVSAIEGPQAQTYNVTKEAINKDLSLMVFINKIDSEIIEREPTQCEYTQLVVEDLIAKLAGEKTNYNNYPIFFGSGKSGFFRNSLEGENRSVGELFEEIIENVKPPKIFEGNGVSLLCVSRQDNQHFKQMFICRIFSGKLTKSTQLNIYRDGELIPTKFMKICKKIIDKEQEIDTAEAGDIVMLYGVDNGDIGDILCTKDIDKSIVDQLPRMNIEDPILSVKLSSNRSPLAGQDGNNASLHELTARIEKESRNDVGIKVAKDGGQLELKLRGFLKLTVILETMRREGYELEVQYPQVIFKTENGVKMEPMETVYINIHKDYFGTINNMIIQRKGVIEEQDTNGDDIILVCKIPSRCLIGFDTELLSSTKGSGVMNFVFGGYEEFKGEYSSRSNGVIISTAEGECSGYSLDTISDRGKLFVSHLLDKNGLKDKVYPGMIIGESATIHNVDANPTREKKLTNMRTTGTDRAYSIPEPTRMDIKDYLSFMKSGETLEITPNFARLYTSKKK